MVLVEDVSKESKKKERKGKSVFYLVRTTARQELNVALLIENRARVNNIPLYSIVIPPDVKGYLVLETPRSSHVELLIRDMQHVKRRVQGTLTLEDVERMVKPKAMVELLNPGDMVEVIAGPFQGIKAQVISVNRARNEVVLNILESAYPLKVTVPGDYVKPVSKG
jgi:transcriptional antiterminator NusG